MAASKKRHARHDIEKGLEDFGDEMGKLGNRISDKVGRERRPGIFGPVGPLLSSIFSILIFVVVVLVLDYVNLFLKIGLISGMTSFLLSNAGYFFLIFLFFGYASYFSRSFEKLYYITDPLVIGVSLLVAFWLASEAISIVGSSTGNPALLDISLLFSRGLPSIFLLGVFLGILVTLARMTSEARMPARSRQVRQAYYTKPAAMKRLYRSGRERILGGVCGGIAEYFGVDPVLVRLIWVAACLLWGAGILLYIIAWIIIPRNPKDRWD